MYHNFASCLLATSYFIICGWRKIRLEHSLFLSQSRKRPLNLLAFFTLTPQRTHFPIRHSNLNKCVPIKHKMKTSQKNTARVTHTRILWQMDDQAMTCGICAKSNY